MYDVRDVYPNLGLVTVHERTIPERAEQQALETSGTKAPEIVDKPGNFWMAFITIVGLMWIFNFI